jgi:hypothetical protein
MNLQINTSLTEGMNGNFSLTQLVENVFFPSVYASTGPRWAKVTCVYENGKLIEMHCTGEGSQWCICAEWQN